MPSSFGIYGRWKPGMVVSVAAYDAPRHVKEYAQFVCRGQQDDATLNRAIEASRLPGRTPRYAGIELSQGRFRVRSPILIRSRGQVIYGQGSLTHISPDLATASASNFVNRGAGSEKALIKVADDEIAQNAVACIVADLYLDCSLDNGASIGNHFSISGIWWSQENGGNNDKNSLEALGHPATVTDGDTYHSIRGLRMRGIRYGVAFDGGSNTNTRGNNVTDVRMWSIQVAGYYTDGASDCHFDQCHAISSSTAGAVGFDMNGGSTRLTGCKAAYFNSSTTSWGFQLASSRVSGGDIEAQDCENGIQISAKDVKVTGARVDTQDTPCTTAFQITNAAVNVSVSSLHIHTRNSGTYQNGLVVPAASAQFGVGDISLSGVVIDPIGIASPFLATDSPPAIGAGATAVLSKGSYHGWWGVGRCDVRVLHSTPVDVYKIAAQALTANSQTIYVPSMDRAVVPLTASAARTMSSTPTIKVARYTYLSAAVANGTATAFSVQDGTNIPNGATLYCEDETGITVSSGGGTSSLTVVRGSGASSHDIGELIGPAYSSAGTDGQVVTLINEDASDTITLQDDGTLASSGLSLGASTRTLGYGDSITLMYSAVTGTWVEIAYSNVT